jgi:hypothetical protein
MLNFGFLTCCCTVTISTIKSHHAKHRYRDAPRHCMLRLAIQPMDADAVDCTPWKGRSSCRSRIASVPSSEAPGVAECLHQESSRTEGSKRLGSDEEERRGSEEENSRGLACRDRIQTCVDLILQSSIVRSYRGHKALGRFSRIMTVIVVAGHGIHHVHEEEITWAKLSKNSGASHGPYLALNKLMQCWM